LISRSSAVKRSVVVSRGFLGLTSMRIVIIIFDAGEFPYAVLGTAPMGSDAVAGTEPGGPTTKQGQDQPISILGGANDTPSVRGGTGG
jgi:hypothetical protein